MVDSSIIYAIGVVVGILIDVTWFSLPYKKIELGFEVLEHYHFGIIFGMFTVISGEWMLAPIFAGIMTMLFIGEWSQNHKFARGSNHYKTSSIIGIILFIGLLFITFGGSLIGL